ncbi:hypothetical protein [Jiella sp. M17.18]|uniref:hypothetical protein n=1 Tax=Jiella sp. M17.18 TaxID=3234247 RepID=UPI0034E039EC
MVRKSEDRNAIPQIVDAPCIDATDLFEDKALVWRLRAQNSAFETLRKALDHESKRMIQPAGNLDRRTPHG